MDYSGTREKQMRICTRCKQIKQESKFFIRKNRKSGYHSECKECTGILQRTWRLNNNEKVKEYGKLYEDNHKKSRKEQHHSTYTANREKVLERNKIWRKNNSEKVKDLNKIGSARLRNTTKGKLNDCMSSGIRSALKGNKAGRHWEELVKFTIDQLKKHLEKRFTSEMNWGNYGTMWEIDHKIPKAVFNFEKPEDIDFRLCWSLKNLQPLEKAKNRRKNSKIEKPFQPSLALGIGG